MRLANGMWLKTNALKTDFLFMLMYSRLCHNSRLLFFFLLKITDFTCFLMNFFFLTTSMSYIEINNGAIEVSFFDALQENRMLKLTLLIYCFINFSSSSDQNIQTTINNQKNNTNLMTCKFHGKQN